MSTVGLSGVMAANAIRCRNPDKPGKRAMRIQWEEKCKMY